MPFRFAEKKIGKMKNKLVLWGILMGWSLLAPLSAQITFETQVSKKQLGLNERLRVDFVMNENGDNFNPPAFEGFQVVSGPQQAVSRSWVNGVRSFSKKYTYFLTPKQKGTLNIQQATVTIDGEVYKTSPVTINVTAAVARPNDPNNVDYLADENLHLVAEISNYKPYLNEAITILYKIYFRNPISISDVQELESPEFSDFWSHYIKIPQVTVSNGTYKNEPYKEVVWRKVVLYPQKTGSLELEPLTLSLNVGIPSNRRDLFGSRIYKQIQKTITAGGVKIKVKPLPLENQPPGFTGAVGQFDFDVVLSKDALKATESFQAKVKVRGNGNLKLFELPKINVPNTLELYEPEHSEQVKTTLKGMQGSIEDSYTIVPQYQGKYPIPQLSFSYFDPNKEEYKTLQSQQLLVDVFDGPIAGNSGLSENVQSKQQNLVSSESAFRFIDLDTSLTWIDQPLFWQSNQYWSLVLSPFAALLLLLVVQKRRTQSSQDEQQVKQRAANRLAKKYLSSAKALLQEQAPFYEALERALHNYLKAKLNIETQEFSKAKIKTLLANGQVTEDTSSTFVKVLENCEQARYAPGTSVNMKKDYENASRIIAILDKELK